MFRILFYFSKPISFRIYQMNELKIKLRNTLAQKNKQIEKNMVIIYKKHKNTLKFGYKFRFQMSEIAHTSPLPYTLSNPSSPLIEHYDEIETNQKWFDSYSTTIREFINPGSTVVTESTPPSVTTQNPSKHGSSASSRLESCMVLLQILALSVSVKLLVRIG